MTPRQMKERNSQGNCIPMQGKDHIKEFVAYKFQCTFRLELSSPRRTNAQLGIFEGRGPIHEKGQLFKEKNGLRILFFRFISGANTMGSLLKLLILKSKDSYYYFKQG